MPKFTEGASKEKSLAPGELVHIGKRRAEKVKITIIDYDENSFQEKEVKKIEESFVFRDASTATWINVDGIHDINVIDKIGKHFNVHPLVLEDILNTGERPKFEDFEDFIFITIIATIFIPITFIAGVYGMNFRTEASGWNMPELNWRYGYIFTWDLMISMALSMAIYFKRKKWL